MTAQNRLEELDQLDGTELCTRTDAALTKLLDIMNKETMLLRAGKMKEAGTLTPEKTQFSQDYVMLARAIQREAKRLQTEVPTQLEALQRRHESLATQMAENLRVIATARDVTESLLTDVAKSVGADAKPKTYGSEGVLSNNKPEMARGLSLDRAL